jgi:triosephosphate isomerase
MSAAGNPIRPLIAANWKMHGRRADGAALAGEIARQARRSGSADLRSEIVICPPATLLAALVDIIADSPVRLGAQDCHAVASGAYTGDISAAMLADAGCRYVIVGHSERRSLYGDSDALVAAKYDAALKAGLTPILCLGETLEQREAGVTAQVVNTQLDAVMDACGAASLGRAVVAYEPVWAIGTGRTATPDQAQEVHALIRARVAGKDPAVAKGLQILYGGSVKASNAKEIFAMPDIDGGLIGGAALVADDFLAIVKAGA